MKIALAILALTLGAVAHSEQVNPTSNVLGDTAKTPGTLVLRSSSNGEFSAESLSEESITTQKIASGAVVTRKLYLDQPSSRIPCITTAKTLGNCSYLVAATGVCNTCN